MRNDEYLCDMNLRHPLFLSLPLLLLSGAASAQGQAQEEEMNYLMVYFTLGMAGGPNGLWYAYADTAFTCLEPLPGAVRCAAMWQRRHRPRHHTRGQCLPYVLLPQRPHHAGHLFLPDGHL